jgi:Pvc16 N-terminal domain/IPT/TIG domain
MAFEDSGRAIGAVTRLLRDRLQARLQSSLSDVTVGRPEPPRGAVNNPRLNLFLYGVQFDGHLANLSLDEGQPAPLWLVLRYLLTAFDRNGESDSINSHELLGQGMRELQDLNFLAANGIVALNDSPDMLKITFEDASTELLSKLMQGSDEKYRCSVAFQVRPVMIATGTPPEYSLLVGVDYQNSVIIGEDGIQIPVLPSLAPAITSVSPARFEVGATVTVQGVDLHLPGLAVRMGPIELPVTSQRPDRLTFVVVPALANGTTISAGNHPLAVVQTLPNGKRRSSNLLGAGLMPRVTAAAARTNLTAAGLVFGFLDLDGELLGSSDDDLFVALFANGRTVRMLDRQVAPPAPPPPPPVPAQTRASVELPEALAVPTGAYRVIVRVNGQQARNSPPLALP